MQRWDARLLSECAGPNGSALRFYAIEGGVTVVQFFPGGGWHNYLGSRSNQLEETEREIEAWAGRSFR